MILKEPGGSRLQGNGRNIKVPSPVGRISTERVQAESGGFFRGKVTVSPPAAPGEIFDDFEHAVQVSLSVPENVNFFRPVRFADVADTKPFLPSLGAQFLQAAGINSAQCA